MVRERSREKQRAEKLLEDAQVKLSSVISDIFGASGRAMLAALIAGQRMIEDLRCLRNSCEPKSNQNSRYLKYSNAVSALLWIISDLQAEQTEMR